MAKILYVIHSGVTGGTFLTNKDLMKNVDGKYEVFLLTAENDSLSLFNFSKGNLTLIKSYTRLNKWSAMNFHDSWLNYIYFDILTNLNIDLVHIRHLINHSFDLPEIAQKLGIPVVLSFHDFFFICPFYVLLDENKKFCNGVCNDNELNCYVPLKSLEDINSKKFILEWRNNVLNLFKYINCFITTSHVVKDIFLSIYPNMDEKNFYIIEHGRDFFNNQFFYEKPSLEKPIKILCPANHINAMKGSEIIKSIKRYDVDSKLEFHFLGNCHDGIDEIGINHGTFERDDFFLRVKEIKPSFIGIFSIWPETFCHTLTEAWNCGIPVLGSNLGVIQDRILKEKGGWILNIDSPKCMYDKILEIASNSDEYNTVLSNIKNIKFKSSKDMADDYLNIYNQLVHNHHHIK